MKSTELRPEVKLRPHQEKAVEKVIKKDGSLLLSHATGSGKTLTAIAAFDKLRQMGKADKALIVAPASLRYNFAEQGVEKFTKSPYVIFGNQQENAGPDARFMDTEAYKASQKKLPYHIVSYDLFRKDPDRYLEASRADTVIYDEIHRGKNEASNITKVMRDIRPKHRNFIGLTGSIVSNTPGDIVPLVDALTEGKHNLGSKAVFDSRFMRQGKDGKKELVNKFVVKNLTAPYIDHVDIEDLEIAPPPQKILKEIKVPMGKHQEDLYRYYMDQLDPITKAKIKHGLGKKIKEREMAGIFSKLMTMRQLSNYTQAVNPSISHAQALAESPKMVRVIEDIKEHLAKTPDAQIVVGSQFISAGITPLKHHLESLGISPAVFIGKGNIGSNEATRQQAINDFNSGKKRVLLISGAGGEGLNLPNTTKIIMLDGHFNPEVMKQMEARGIRAGGLSHRDPKDRKVEVTRYMSVPTYRKSDMAVNLLDTFSPNTYVHRIIEGQKLFQNPIKRPRGTDELVGQIAERKDELNSDIKGLWKKGAAQTYKPRTRYLYDPKTVLRKYQNEFGELMENDAPTNPEGWYNPEKEMALVNEYRDIMGSVATKSPSIKHKERVGEKGGLGFSEKDFDPNTNVLPIEKINKKALKTALLSSAFLAPIGGIYFGAYARQVGVPYKYGIPVGAAMGTGSAALGAIMERIGHKNTLYHTMPVAKARRARNLTDEEIRDILRGQVIKKEIIKEDQHYI